MNTPAAGLLQLKIRAAMGSKAIPKGGVSAA
jgi:hypothetical protein